jgi:hypothetical protein
MALNVRSAPPPPYRTGCAWRSWHWSERLAGQVSALPVCDRSTPLLHLPEDDRPVSSPVAEGVPGLDDILDETADVRLHGPRKNRQPCAASSRAESEAGACEGGRGATAAGATAGARCDSAQTCGAAFFTKRENVAGGRAGQPPGRACGCRCSTLSHSRRLRLPSSTGRRTVRAQQLPLACASAVRGSAARPPDFALREER